MSAFYLGYPNHKTREEIEYRNMETIDGKWIVYESNTTQKYVLSNYTEDDRGRVWEDETAKNKVIFGRSIELPIPVPVWQFYKNDEKITLENNYPGESKIKSLKSNTENITVKWQKPPTVTKYRFLVTSDNIDDPEFCSELTVKVNSIPVSMTYKEQQEIQEGSTVEYTITMKLSSFEISKINDVEVGPEEKRTCTRTFTMSEDTTIIVSFL